MLAIKITLFINDFICYKLFLKCSRLFIFIFFFDSRGVSGPAYAQHDYSPRLTGHPASPGAGKAPRG